MDYEKQRANHDLSHFKFFNLLYILTPFTGRYRRFDFDGGTIRYQDIYVFGIRVIRWQL